MLPFIILNMGGEMLYILDQRLRDQDLDRERSAKILGEISEKMFSNAVVNEIFRPQSMYTIKSTKQIFSKVAHSSNRKLDEAAM